MNSLGNTYQQMGRYGEAEALHCSALEIKRKVLGMEHPDTLRSMNNLATTLWSAQRYAEAAALLNETIAARRRVLRGDHPEILSSMHNLGLVYKDENRLALAEKLFREAAAAREREPGPSHPLTLDDMYMVGCLAARRGDWPEAMRWLRRAVELGYRDHVNDVTMAEDDTFGPLRADPELQALAARVRRSD